jgi:hypothetical protein
VDTLNNMLLGAVAFGCLIVALYFYRFWRKGRDRFFLLFSLSFGVEGLNRVALGLLTERNEGTPEIYLVRLVAFGLILVAILDKNRVVKR